MMSTIAVARAPSVPATSSCRAFSSAKATRVAASKRDARAHAASEDIGTAGSAAAALGLVASPICLWSEYTLKTTGAGLQGDVLGGIEGISYLVIVGIVAWSLYTKVQTGSGLPAGPSGLLGAAEGFSYLALVTGLVVFALNSAGI